MASLIPAHRAWLPLRAALLRMPVDSPRNAGFSSGTRAISRRSLRSWAESPRSPRRRPRMTALTNFPDPRASRIVSPPRDELDRLRTPLEPGERLVFDFFDRTLSSDWEIYVQPHLNN